jgi:hypothetical protein
VKRSELQQIIEENSDLHNAKISRNYSFGSNGLKGLRTHLRVKVKSVQPVMRQSQEKDDG